MRIRHIVFTGFAVAAALAVSAPAHAQQGTVITNSGERVSGHIRDMDANGFTVDVGGSERRIMRGDIAAVDFAGSARELTSAQADRVRQGQQAVVLRNGDVLVGRILGYERTMEGKLADLPKDHAFRINFQVEGAGERSFLSSDVARIYFGEAGLSALGAGTGTSGQTPSTGGRQIVVSSTRDWTPTGITVRRGETLRIESSGRIQLGLNADDAAQPAGSVTGRTAPNAPVRTALAGALIGRIDNGQPFLIGGQTTVRMPANGQLYLGVNDDGLQDNSGEFTVVIDRSGARRR